MTYFSINDKPNGLFNPFWKLSLVTMFFFAVLVYSVLFTSFWITESSSISTTRFISGRFKIPPSKVIVQEPYTNRLFDKQKSLIESPDAFSRKTEVISTLTVASFISNSTIEKSNMPKKYLSSNLASSLNLGSHLFELSAILELSRELQRTPTFFIEDHYHEKMLKNIDLLTPGLIDHFLIVNSSVPASIKQFEFHKKCCIFEDPEKLKKSEKDYLHIKGTHFQSWKYFPHHRKEFISYLRAQNSDFDDLPISSDNSLIVCVDTKRVELEGSGFFVADEDFILKREKTDLKINYVLFGDDSEFSKDLLKLKFLRVNDHTSYANTSGIIFEKDAHSSILYSRHHCDVVMITAPRSTIGWWMGYLSEGNQVYYTDIRHVEDVSIPSGTFDPDDYFLPHWIPIRLNENGTVIESA